MSNHAYTTIVGPFVTRHDRLPSGSLTIKLGDTISLIMSDEQALALTDDIRRAISSPALAVVK